MSKVLTESQRFLRDLAHLTIRWPTNKDRKRVIELVFAVLAEYGLHADLENTDADLQDIQANYSERGGPFELIEAPERNLLGSVGPIR
jgi:hypothetical protein